MNEVQTEITAVMLAQDVLKWLDGPANIKFMDGGHGYCIILEPNGRDVQANFQEGKTCEVCAIGGLAVALASRIDNLSLTTMSKSRGLPAGWVGRDDLVDFLAPYFSEVQLHLIERVYEGAYYYGNASSRLRYICTNIIENNGTFVQSPPLINADDDD